MNGDVQPGWMGPLLKRLDKMEALLGELLRRRAVKDWYSTDEVAEILGKATFTVREWCRHGRVHCRKKNNGRGVGKTELTLEHRLPPVLGFKAVYLAVCVTLRPVLEREQRHDASRDINASWSKVSGSAIS